MPTLIGFKKKSNKNQVFADQKDFADAAYRWRDEGYLPIPLRLKDNGDLVPAIKWGDVKSVSDADIESWFGPECVGIAIKAGATFGGLIDIDLDCPEAVQLAPRFLPQTQCVFGRPGNPASHYLYHVDHPDSIKKTTFHNPGGGKPIVEILADGQISTVPPTVKAKLDPSEKVSFEIGKAGLPSDEHYTALLTAVRRLAAASVILRLYPTKGSRHDAAVALSGALLRADLGVVETRHFIAAVAKAANDLEIEDRLEAVNTTAAKLAKGQACWGWPKLTGLLGDEVKVCAKWLGVDATDTDSGDLGYADCILTGAQLTSLEISPPEWLIEGVIAKSSITLVQGRYKAFKTMTGYGIAEALCRGTDFVGYSVPEKRRVLLVDGEMPLSQSQERYYKIIGPAGNDAFLILSNHQRMLLKQEPIDITDERHQTEIERCIAEHNIDAVVFDNYASLRALVEENESSDGGWQRLRRWLLYLRFNGTAAILVHHTGHGGQHARGTSDLPGIVDTIIHQERINETKYKISFTCRGPQPDPGEKIIYVKDHGEVIILTGADVKPDDWPAILKVIKAGGFKTQTELAEKLGEAFGTKSWKQATVSKKLKAGQEKGYIGKDKKLTEAGENLILEGKEPPQEYLVE